MDDKNEQIYSQYRLDINNVYKKRGFIYLETKDGLYMVKPYNYTEKKAETENLIREVLIKRGFDKVDYFIRNNSQGYLTQNKYGNTFILKKWFDGEECDISNLNELEKASRNLGKLHKITAEIELDEEGINIPKKNILSDYECYNNELKRVKKYIYNKKKKSKLELEILKYIDSYYKEAELYYKKLKDSEYEKMYHNALDKGSICHGNYTHHSFLMCEDFIATVNFDKLTCGVIIYDLYCFLRKTMEKNDWNIELGLQVIDFYNSERELSKEEKEILYIFIAYPDKFRKLVNSYYNGKKSLVSVRISEKLEKLISSELKKKEFLLALEKKFAIQV